MGETGKRYRQHSNEGKNQKKRTGEKENPGGGELVVYRILCPSDVIGSVIGKGGKVINSLRQETQARIKVVDPFPNTNKRVITIYCYVKDKDDKDIDPMDVDEDYMEPLCPAQDALLKVHTAIMNAVANAEDSDKTEEAEILVPASQAANIIGKSGSVIKKLRAKTNTNIRVNKKDTSDAAHSCAMNFDNFVLISGDADAVKKALFSVSAIMYKFSPKEEISLDTAVSDLPPSIIIPSDVPIYPGGNFYPNVDAIIPPHRSVPSTTSNVPGFPGYTETSSAWPVFPSALPVVPPFSGPSRSEDLVVRVLCPSDKIGRVIGKGGSAIKSIRQQSGARIDVDDKKDESEECLVIVTSTESTDDSRSAAIDAVLLLQEKINDEDEETVNIRLLVPTKAIGCLIGKSGSIINEIRKTTKSDIRISKGEKPKSASSNDELIEVFGEAVNLRDALTQIILRLREYILRGRDGGQNAPSTEPLYPASLSIPPAHPVVPPVAPLGYDQRTPGAPLGYDQRAETGSRHGMLTSSGLYGYNSLRAGEDAYGPISSYSTNAYGGLAFAEMPIPSHAVGKVIGKGGANLANIRKISGASVEIVDSKTSHSERVAHISGTPEQKRDAENLIRAFIMAT